MIRKGILVIHNFKTSRHKYKLSSCRDKIASALTMLPEAPTTTWHAFLLYLTSDRETSTFSDWCLFKLIPKFSLQVQRLLRTRLAFIDLDPRLSLLYLICLWRVEGAATKLFGSSHRIGWENDIQTMVIMNPSLKKNRASCQQDPMKLEVRSRELRDNRNNSNLSLWQCPLSFSLTHANYKLLTWHDLLKFSDCT